MHTDDSTSHDLVLAARKVQPGQIYFIKCTGQIYLIRYTWLYRISGENYMKFQPGQIYLIK